MLFAKSKLRASQAQISKSYMLLQRHQLRSFSVNQEKKTSEPVVVELAEGEYLEYGGGPVHSTRDINGHLYHQSKLNPQLLQDEHLKI